MSTNNDQVIKDAQYRKGLSIAFFNATNSAISMCQGMNVHEKTTLDKIIELRDLFLDEHKKYYAEVIANVGNNYDSKTTIEKLKTSKNIDELKSLWISLSEDERRDGDIIKEVNLLKKKYEKN
jgi:hypothetical protein